MTYPKGTASPSKTTSASDTASTTDMTEEAVEVEAEVEAGDAAQMTHRKQRRQMPASTSTVDQNIQRKIDSIKNVANAIRMYRQVLEIQYVHYVDWSN